MFSFLQNFTPDPVLFSFGFLTVYWYGVLVTTGMALGIWIISSLAKRYNISQDEVYNLGFYTIIFALIGARAFSVILDFSFYLQHPSQIIAVWNGGLSIHGGIVGGVLTMLVYAHRKRQNVWRWMDVAVPGLALGQAIGRWGNYFNQEIFGGPTDLPWGIPIELTYRPLQHINSTHFHPTFLYESILNFINFGVLYFLHKKGVENSGMIAAVYLMNYSVIRGAMELLRTDPVPLVLGIRMTLWWTIIAFAIGAAVYMMRLKKKV